MQASHAASAYARNAVLTASPEKIVLMLYDRAIQQIEAARTNLVTAAASGADGDINEAGEAIGRAFSIVGELKNTLRHEHAPLAHDLDRLYDFTLDQLALAQQDRAAAPLDAGLKVLRTLKEGWDGIVVGA